MTDLLMTPAGDLDLSSGGLQLTVPGSDQEVAQTVRQRLRFIRGEWFLDRAAGVPYMTEVLIARPNLAHIRTAFRREILETDGVVRLSSLSTDFDPVTRILAVSARINNRIEIAEEIQR